MTQRCKCEHWQFCPVCAPQMFDGNGNRLPPEPTPLEAAKSEIERLRAENERLRESIGVAYGYLWCVNNEPGTSFQYPPEKAAYAARAVLRDTMTSEQRGTYINRAVALVRGKRPMPLPSTAIDAARREK